MSSTVLELIVENVRSFVGRHAIGVKPLTLLVGENSSGKTTLLASLAAVCDPSAFPFRPRFNEPPYALGTFETIATHKGGRYGRATTFSLGFAASTGSGKEVLATYSDRLGQPQLTQLHLSSDGGEAELALHAVSDPRRFRLQFAGAGETWSTDLAIDGASGGLTSEYVVLTLLEFIYGERRAGRGKLPRSRLAVSALVNAFADVPPLGATSVAPIRTRPRRTYDEALEQFTPEGEHIPLTLLNHLAINGPGSGFLAAVHDYGKEAGLFREVHIKRLGSKPGDPFQIMVKGTGRPSNLIDVGYGVSQALPVVGQSVLAPANRLVLMQQPEVHLHPRAQAELGSFFVNQVYRHDKKLVIETHSDYIVDRVRLEVARQRLDPAMVSILYLEKTGHETHVFPLRLDERGNVQDAPASYRAFFLREEMNLLARMAGKE